MERFNAFMNCRQKSLELSVKVPFQKSYYRTEDGVVNTELDLFCWDSE